MVMTASAMLTLGTKAPDFELLDVVTEKKVQLLQIAPSNPFVIVFMCNHCPFVKHILPSFIKLANDYLARGIAFVAISSNDASAFPADGPEKMAELAKSLQFPFPYLYDETQAVAKAYHAACTPDFYLFDENKLCVYRGQFDDSRPGNTFPVSGVDLRAALDAVLEHRPVDAHQKPSIGCNIKWKI